MNNITISVIIPVYNTGSILQETINSVLEQSFRNLELIIIDDGSTDAITEAVIDRQTDERIKVIRQANGGVASARNRGMGVAKGKYIAFLDHDDLFLPEKLQKICDIFEQNKDAVLVYSGTIPLGDYHNRRIELKKAEGRIFSSMIAQNPILSMSCSVIDRDFMKKYDIID